MMEEKQLVDKLTNNRRPLEFKEIYHSSILRISPDYLYNLEEGSVLHFSATLLDLEEAIEFCFDSNLSSGSPFKELGLHLFYIHETFPGALMLFSGDRKELKAYSILLKRAGDIELDEALNIIRGALVKHGS